MNTVAGFWDYVRAARGHYSSAGDAVDGDERMFWRHAVAYAWTCSDFRAAYPGRWARFWFWVLT